MAIDLALIWALLIAFAILAYVVLDGFDLGVGILFPLVRDGTQRGTMMNTVAPVWDGNETWLVLGGGGLFAAFPLAYAVLMPAFYAPLIAMLLGLVFRGVAFEFRFRSQRRQHLWDMAFTGGSLLAAFSQGVMLGAFVQGVTVAERAYGGGWYDWVTPFSLFTGASLVAGYALLGAGWLILKTEGALQQRFYSVALPLVGLVVAMIGGVSLWTPFLDEAIAERWFTWPNLLIFSPVPLLVAALALLLFFGVTRHRDSWPFLSGLGLFLLSYVGLGISLFPYIVPRTVTIWEAAAPPQSLSFMLVGAAVLLPIILGYTGYVYWVFRGKIDPDAGYH